jgi:folylpolyglutamate synthase/dihydropteroate synthase
VSEEDYLSNFWQAWDTLNDGVTFGSVGGEEEWEAGPPTSGQGPAPPPSPSSSSSSSPPSSLLLAPPPPFSPPPSSSSSSSSSSFPGPFASLPPLPGFNFLTLIALHLFHRARVDVIVLEVGLGGRLDATNSVPASRVACCAITTLDFDHVELLGGTLPEIAGEKAGILRPGVPAVTAPQRGDALARLCSVAAEEGTPLFLASEDVLAGRFAGAAEASSASTSSSSSASSLPFPPLGLDGRFQRTNAAVAVALTDLFFHQLREGRVTLGPGVGTGAGVGPSSPSDLAPPPSTSGQAAAARPPRSSSFSDTFGATPANAPPRTGVYACPPPVYDAPSPLDAGVLAGLAGARWPGRAQTLLVDVDTGRLPVGSTDGGASAAAVAGSPSSPPSAAGGAVLRLCIDGAHTEKSMKEAAGWFSRQQATATATMTRGATAPRRVLLFYCGSDKDVLSLLLPLSSLTSSSSSSSAPHSTFFDEVHIAPVPWALTPRSAAPTPAEALAGYLGKKRTMGDLDGVEELERGMREEAAAALAAAAPPSSSSSGSGAVAPPQPPPPAAPGKRAWLDGLAVLWDAVHTRPELRGLRSKLAAEIGSGCGAAASPSPLPLPLTTPARVHDSVTEALAAIRASAKAAAAGTGAETQVLVTGSLYLAGAVLEEAGFRP